MVDAEIDAALDAFESCAAGDGLCAVACVGTDPDCTTTCGDGRCVGNAGELCNNCNADCKTMNPVCGNGACDPGEAMYCFADCGPAPWPWTADQDALFTLINQTRTAGVTCPGGSFATAPAVSRDPVIEASEHAYVWEIAHQGYYESTGMTCDGRTGVQRAMANNFNAFMFVVDVATPQDAMNYFVTTATTCALLMDPSFTVAGAAVAKDAHLGYEIVLR